MWMQLRWNITETDPLEEFQEWGMGIDGGGDERCPLCNRSSWNYYRMVQGRVMQCIAGLGSLPLCPMWLLLMGGAQLRRVPLYSRALVLSLLPFIAALRGVVDRVHLMAPTRVPSYLLEQFAKRHFGWEFCVYVVLIWVAAPAMSATARQQGRAREVSRAWIVLMLTALAYWTLTYLRVFNGWRTLYAVLETDHGLEGVAAAVTYLTSSLIDLDQYFATMLPMAVGIIYSTLSRSGGKPHPHPCKETSPSTSFSSSRLTFSHWL